MSVSSTTTKNSHSGNGSTTAFAYSFKIFADADLQVIIRASNGAEATKSLSTHYNVSGAGSESGGTVTFTGGNTPASGETVVIRRNLGLTQATDYVENDPFPAESHEDALDRLTFIAQGIQEELDRSFKVSKTNSITTPEFVGDASTRASKLLNFSSDGNTLETALSVGEIATATTKAAEAAASAVDSAGSAADALASKNAAAASAVTAGDKVVLATDQANLATTNGAAQVTLATAQVGLATDQVALAAAEVVLAADEVVLATAQKTAAVAAKDDAVIAKNAAETAKTAAENAEAAAATSATSATSSANAAEAAAAAIYFEYETSTSMANPSAGGVRFNNASMGSVTQITFSATSASTGNPDVSDYIIRWDDSTSPVKGHIIIRESGAPGSSIVFAINGSITDSTTHLIVPVSHITSAGVSLSASDDLYFSFTRTGDAGDLSDPMTTRGDIIIRNSSNALARLATGAANRVLISDGTDPAYGQVPLTSAVSGILPLANGGTNASTAAAARTQLGLGTAAVAASTSFEAVDSDILRADTIDELAVGYSGATTDAGVKTGGTFTPSPDTSGGGMLHYTNGGAHTLGVPAKNCSLVILMKNNVSAGAVTTSSFTKVDGDSLTTTNSHEFFLYLTRYSDGSTTFSTLTVKALQ